MYHKKSRSFKSRGFRGRKKVSKVRRGKRIKKYGLSRGGIRL